MKCLDKKILALTVAAGMVMSVSTAHAERVLRAASFAPFETTWGAPFGIFIDHVNEIGEGVLKIRPIGPDAIPATEQPNALRSGLVDLIANPPGMYKHIVPEANAQDLSNMSIDEQKASGGYEALREITRNKLGANILTTYGPGVNFNIYLRSGVDNVEDLEGLRVRSQPIFQPFLSSLGMNATTVPIPEVYTALERGVIQGYAFAGWGVQDLGWDDYTEIRVEPGFYNVVINVLVNESVYNSLSAEEQEVLDSAASWFNEKWPIYRQEQEKIHLAAQEASGVKVVDFGESFATAAENVYWDVLSEESPETIAELRSLLQK